MEGEGEIEKKGGVGRGGKARSEVRVKGGREERREKRREGGRKGGKEGR